MGTSCRLACVVAALLAMTGRVTMLGLSRWTGKGGSYRTEAQKHFCKPAQISQGGRVR
jgi:putative transposase